MRTGLRLSRRSVLHGLGATIALPFLEIMGGKTLAAAMQRNDPPRLACFYIPGGINHYNWFPEETGPKYTLAPSHLPLAHHRDDFSVLTSLSHIEGRITGHVHPYNWLTGHNINITPGAITNTVSMDQVAAKYVGPTYLPSLSLSWHDGIGTSTLSRNALGVDIPAIADYRTVFNYLFPPSDKDQLKAAQGRIALDRSILDTALADVKDLRRKLGYIDQQRVDQYLESIRDVEQRLTDRESILERGRPAFDEENVKLIPQGKNSMQEHIELMMDLIALAFQTDMTRVVTQVLGGEGGPNYEEYKTWSSKTGAPLRGAHDFHHKGTGNRGADNPDVRVIGLRDAMFSACLARLMDKLKAIETKDGTLLDHTVLLMGGSQVSSHSGGNFPMLLAGGKKLGFKHGQHVKWKSNERSASDLYLTILQQMGCPVKSFKESTGPLTEILA
jgi:hypothetical protein